MHANLFKWNICICLSLIAGLIGQVFFYYFKLVIPGLAFFAAAIILFVFYDRQARPHPEILISKKNEIILFLVILFIAVLFRFVLIDSIPAACFSDEAENGIIARSLMNTSSFEGEFLPVYFTGNIHNPTAFLYIMAAVFKVIGVGPTQIRITAAIIGVIAVPAFYFLLRCLLGPFAALIGAFLLAVMRWHVNFSRIGFHCILSVTVLILVLYFVVRAYRERKWFDFILAGFTTALSQYTYTAARLILVWIFILCIYFAFKDPDFYRNNWKKITATLIILLITYMPLGIYSVKYPYKFFLRQGQVFLLDRSNAGKITSNGKNMAYVFGETCAKTFGVFNVHGDNNGRHNLPGQPMLDFFTGIAALIGFGCVLCRFFVPEYFIFISYFVVFLAAGLFSIEAPQVLRTVTVIPAVLFFAAVFYKKLALAIRSKKTVIVMIACLLTASCAESVYLYFGPQAHNTQCRSLFSNEEFDVVKYISGLGRGWHGIVSDDSCLYGNAAYFITGDKIKDYENFNISNPFPVKPGTEMNTYYIIQNSYGPVVDAIKEIFPHAEIYKGMDPYCGKEYWFTGIKVQKQDIVDWNLESVKHGLTCRYYKGTHWTGKPVFTENEQLIICELKNHVLTPPMSAEYTGKIRIEIPGEYIFMVQTGANAQLYINGKEIVKNREQTESKKTESGGVILGKGMHSIKLRISTEKNDSMTVLWWLPPANKIKKLVSPMALYNN